MSFLVQSGIKLSQKSGKLDTVEGDGPVQCYHVDKDRDERLGFAMSKYNLNYIFDTEDTRDYKFRDTLKFSIDPTGLPSQIDLRGQWGDILDQGSLGSCVSHSVVYQLRYLIKKSTGKTPLMSRLFIYYNGRVVQNFPINQDTGLTMRGGFQSVTAYGAADESLWPYSVSRFATKAPDSVYNVAKGNKTLAYYSVAQNLNEIKKCLKDGYAVSFGIALYDSFMSSSVAQTGQVPVPNKNSERRVGGHAMTIVGYNDSTQRFIVANQWSRGWGDNGYCYIPYSMLLDSDTTGDLWTPRSYSAGGVTPTPVPSPTPAPAPSPKPAPTPAPAPGNVVVWAPDIQYQRGQQVSYMGGIYRCNISHKSISSWTPSAVPALWIKIG